MGLFSGILGTIGTVFGGPIGGAIGGIVGGLGDQDRAEEGVRDQNNANTAQAANNNAFNAEQARISREFNSAEAVKNRDWLAGMSNTSWQRGVADMQSAGLNPMLAYGQGGASSPGSSPASGSSASGVQARMENAKAAGIEQAIIGQRLSNETSVAQSTAAVNEANARKIEAETVNVPATGAQIKAQTEKITEEVREVRERVNNIMQDTSLKIDQGNLARVNQELSRMQTAVAHGTLPVQQADIALKKMQTLVDNFRAQHSELDIARSKAEEKFYGSDVGQGSAAVRFVTELLKVLSFVSRR